MPTTSRPFAPLTVTAIGSMPGASPEAAARAVLAAAPALPAWPQLPALGPQHGMLAEVAQGIPGAALSDEGHVVLPAGFGHRGEAQSVRWRPPDGLRALLRLLPPQAPALKGQLAGPVTLALHARLADGRPAVADAVACGALAAAVGALAARQEAHLRAAGRPTLLLLDEPALHQGLTDPYLGPLRCAELLAQALGTLQGLRGVHTCSEPDIAFLARLPLHVLSFDAARYGHALAPEPLSAFLARGGWVAWGAAPCDPEVLASTDGETLAGGLTALWAWLERAGVDGALLRCQALITPACGLATLPPALAQRALALAGATAAVLAQAGQPVAVL